MAFEIDEADNNKDWPTDLIEEHKSIVEWVRKHPHRAEIDYLTQRTIDKENGVALYYIRGFGMGDAKNYALVRKRDIFIFYADRAGVKEIEVPEKTELRRNDIQTLIVAALTVHENRFGFSWRATANDTAVFENATWLVIPQKYSLLYWREKAASWLKKKKAAAAKAPGILASPLIALLLFGVSLTAVMVQAAAIWTVIVSGIWLTTRLAQYDDDFRPLWWFVGMSRPRSPLFFTKHFGRLLAPKPLAALTVRIEDIDPSRLVCTLKVTNNTFFPVPFLSIGAPALADLLAPGWTDSLRAKNNGAIDGKELNKIYSDLDKKWMLPRQTIVWSVPLLKDYPIVEKNLSVKALVTISRFVSGEPRSGATSYILAVLNKRAAP
jgi:hypothetical protein